MKTILILVLALGSLCAVFAQSVCHDENVCTAMGGCRWITVCKPAAQPLPPPPAPPAPATRPVQCHDENICTPMGGCRWVTICK